MSLFRYKGSRVWTFDFVFQGQRIRESTGTRNKSLARTMERNRRTALEEGSAGVKRVKTGRLFKSVAEEYIATEEASLNPNQKGGHASTVRVDRFNLKHLLPVFGKKLLVDITPLDIARYQQKRLQAGAATQNYQPRNRDLSISNDSIRSVGSTGSRYPDAGGGQRYWPLPLSSRDRRHPGSL